jgi:hypothetical protein
MYVPKTFGNTGMGTVQFLHGQDETKIPGARKIIDKIYVGGELCALLLIQSKNRRCFFIKVYVLSVTAHSLYTVVLMLALTIYTCGTCGATPAACFVHNTVHL